MAKKIQVIKWKSVEWLVSKIKPTPKNYKIKTELGQERLQMSLKLFGLAGNVIINTDGTLIDGNSRLEEAKTNGEKKIWVSLPNRKLTSKEFQEMSAMYDFAKAGEVDINRIEGDLGKTEDFFKKWNLEPSMVELVKKMGKDGGKVKDLEYPEEGDGKASKGKGKKAGKASGDAEFQDMRMVQLYFTEKQEKLFRDVEELVQKKFNTGNTTVTAFKIYSWVKNNIKSIKKM
jgi:hypothetical protein